MFSMSSQNTRRKVRLNEKVESRVRGDLYARFGGECLETYHYQRWQGAGCLAYGVFGNSRYNKVNLEAYARHRTVEFRQHGGSTNFTKMKNWILFLNRMITFAQHAKVASGTTLQNLPFLDEDQKTYFKLRTKKLSR